jgi:hypothetical protein
MVASNGAKTARLQAFNEAKAAADLTYQTRSAARIALIVARESRQLERETTKLNEIARIADEKAKEALMLENAERAEIEAREIASKARMAHLLGEDAAKKMERDLRYANRKARQK